MELLLDFLFVFIINIYLILIYSLFFLICSYIYTTISFIMLISYALTQWFYPLMYPLAISLSFLYYQLDSTVGLEQSLLLWD